MIVRPLTPADIVSVDALWEDTAAPFPGAASVLEVSRSLPMRAFVAEDTGGDVIGYASVILQPTWHRTHAPLRLRVRHDRRGAGVGRALWQAIEREGWSGPLMTHVDEADAASRATARRHGGVEGGLHVVSILDLATAHGAPAPDPRATVRTPDLSDPAQRDLVYDLLIERAQDAPDVGRGNALIPRAQFDAWLTESWQVLILQYEGMDAGLTAATVAGTEAHITFTGTAPHVRGRGLAAWLKRSHAVVLRDRGFRTLRTDNMSTNAAILAVNAAAGFRRTGGFLDVLFE